MQSAATTLGDPVCLLTSQVAGLAVSDPTLLETVYVKYRALFDPRPDSEPLCRRGVSLGITSSDLLNIIRAGLAGTRTGEVVGAELYLPERKCYCVFIRVSLEDLRILLVEKKISPHTAVDRAWRLHRGGKRAVIKYCKRDLRCDASQLQMRVLRNEYRMLKKLLHGAMPVIWPLALCDTDTERILVMKSADGDLGAYLDSLDGRLPEHLWEVVSRGVIASVGLCHERGIYHGDIGLQNLLYKTGRTTKGKPFRVFLADFAGSVDHETYRRSVSSDRRYEPWQFYTTSYWCEADRTAWRNQIKQGGRRKQSLDSSWQLLLAQDVYALGKVLLFLRLGAAHSACQNPTQYYAALIKAGISDKQAQLICQMLSSDWRKRPVITQLAQCW